MNTDAMLIEIASGARAVARASSPANMFKALLDASRTVAPRACVFLVRKGQVQGWGCVGYPTEAASVQRTFRAPANQGWIGQVAQDAEGNLWPRPGGTNGPDFGQPPSAEMVGCAVAINGKAVAVLLVERSEGETPWIPEGLALLADLAQLRLELGLVRRRLAEAETAEPIPRQTPAEPAPSLATEPEEASSPGLDSARRYARLVATDIRLYNEEAVMLGRRHGDLIERLGEHLDRGKETFLRRHGDLGPTGIELLREAYVQVLAAGDAALIPAERLEQP